MLLNTAVSSRKTINRFLLLSLIKYVVSLISKNGSFYSVNFCTPFTAEGAGNREFFPFLCALDALRNLFFTY
jgi:hypothetical protein